MNKKIFTLLFMTAFLSGSILSSGVPKAYTNTALDGTTITIDGEMEDWAGINPVSVTLKPARVSADLNASISADFYSTHDDTKIYFLVVVTDPYFFYNFAAGINHRYAPALAIGFPITVGANAEYMGGTDRDTVDNLETSTGEVDIMHWEIDTLAGDLAGGTKNSTTGAKFGDGKGNLDDEYSTSAAKGDRNDDNDAATSENSYSGAWGFSVANPTNGTVGDWMFEISRDLQTGDIHDAQFAETETIEVAIAYWTPNEKLNNKWTDDGHYVNYDNVIEMTLKAAPKEDDSPGFGLIIAFSGIFVMAIILKKRS